MSVSSLVFAFSWWGLRTAGRVYQTLARQIFFMSLDHGLAELADRGAGAPQEDPLTLVAAVFDFPVYLRKTIAEDSGNGYQLAHAALLSVGGMGMPTYQCYTNLIRNQ
jgi:hypothetical protein